MASITCSSFVLLVIISAMVIIISESFILIQRLDRYEIIMRYFHLLNQLITSVLFFE